MGKGGTCKGGHLPPPSEMLKSVFLPQMLSKTSVDEVFMHHFEKMSSASGGLAPIPPPGSCPWTLLGHFRPSDPLIAHTWKKYCGRPCTEVNLRRARLVLRWVNVSGFNCRCRTFISVCNQPHRPTQPSIPPGSVNEDQLRLGRKKAGMSV